MKKAESEVYLSHVTDDNGHDDAIDCDSFAENDARKGNQKMLN